MPDNSWTIVMSSIATGVITWFIVFMSTGSNSGSRSPRLDACSEFVNSAACECWVNDSCGTDIGRSSAKLCKKKKGN